MKKLFFAAAAVFAFGMSHAQETRFGAKAGLDFVSFDTVGSSGSIGVSVNSRDSNSITGFYVGGFATIGLTEKFGFQPELLFVKIQDSKGLILPVLARYTVKEKINILAGPSINYSLDDIDSSNKTKINVDLGGSFDINENFILDARYSLGFGDNKASSILFGFGYKL
jgi:Outer membrane protein beta-barrel domain